MRRPLTRLWHYRLAVEVFLGARNSRSYRYIMTCGLHLCVENSVELSNFVMVRGNITSESRYGYFKNQKKRKDIGRDY